MYADDTCLYFSFSPAVASVSIENFESCVSHLCDWFNSNRLKINSNKTEFMIFNPLSNNAPEYVTVSGVKIFPSSLVRYLGVKLDASLSFEQHIIDVFRSCFAFLRSLYRIRSFMPESTLMSMVNVFIYSRMDYCNSLFSFCKQRTLGRLQRVQNCLARLVKRLPRRSPTSTAIKDLGWLRIEDRISFKILCMTHKCIYGSSPSYLKELLLSPGSVSSTFSLRSHSSIVLHAPISTNAFVRRSFSFTAPRLWNSLPPTIRDECSYNVFKRLLKAHFSL